MYYTKDSKGFTRVTGRSKAIVIDNRDPEKRGQVQISHPILGETVWIPYLRTPNSFDPPEIGDIVYVECDTGHHSYGVAWGNVTKQVGDEAQIPEAFQRDVPTNRGQFSPGGHLIELDDGEAEPAQDPAKSEQTTKNRGVRITTLSGTKLHLLDDDDNGTRQIVLEDPDGNYIIIDRENKSMDINIDGKYNVVATDETKYLTLKSHTIDAGEDVYINAERNVDITATENANMVANGDAKVVALGKVTIDTPETAVTGTLDVDGDVSAKANLNVTGTSMLAGGTPLVLSTAQFIGTGNLGAPVISSIMSGQATKVLGS